MIWFLIKTQSIKFVEFKIFSKFSQKFTSFAQNSKASLYLNNHLCRNLQDMWNFNDFWVEELT